MPREGRGRADRTPPPAPPDWTAREAASEGAGSSAALLAPEECDKENSALPSAPGSSAATPKTAADSDRTRRVHFRPAHDVLLLKAVRAQQAHLKGAYGSAAAKWAIVQHDVTSAVRQQLADPGWAASVRTLQERLKTLLAECSEQTLNEARAARQLGRGERARRLWHAERWAVVACRRSGLGDRAGLRGARCPPGGAAGADPGRRGASPHAARGARAAGPGAR